MNRLRIAGAAVALVSVAWSGVVALPAWANSVTITTSTPVTDGSAPITFQVTTDPDATTRCVVHQGNLGGTSIEGIKPCIDSVVLDVTGYDSGKYTIEAISFIQGTSGTYVTSSTEFWIDQEGPKVVVTTGGAFTLDKTADVKWKAPNEPTNDSTYERQIRQGNVTHGLSGWSGLADTDQQTMQLPLDRGDTFCLRVRGTDVLGNVGEWSDGACVTRPLDERDLDGWQGKDSGWKTISEENFVNTTGLVATADGSSLVLDDARIDSLAVWGRKGPFGGKLEVKVDGKVVGTASFNSKTPKRAVVFRQDFKSTQRGKIVLTVVTTGRPVTLDAVGIFSS